MNDACTTMTAVETEARPGAPAEPSSRKCVLIVDDHDTVRSLLKRIAEDAGAKAIAVPGARDMFRALAAPEDVSLIILDLIMPAVSGWDVLNMLKQKPELSHIPIVILSGACLSLEETRGLMSRASAVIHKNDFDAMKFKQLLSDFL